MGEMSFNNNVTVYVRPGMKFDIEAHMDANVVHAELSSVRIGGLSLNELRDLKEIALPAGAEVVGEKWFAGCGVERVVIPASVREIQADAFWRCRQLASLEFEEGSALEAIGQGAFRETKLEALAFPSQLGKIADEAFACCGELRSMTFGENSRLTKI